MIHSLSFISIMVFTIIVIQIIISKYYPKLILNDYLFTSIIIFFFLYLFTKNITISLFGTLFTFLLNTFLHYQKMNYENPSEDLLFTDSRIFIPFILFLSLFIYFIPNDVSNKINIINMIIIFYIVYSLFEWFLHKYVMHAKDEDIFYKKMKDVPIIENYINDSKKSHIIHHIETDCDMKLKEDHKHKEGLFFHWKVFLPVYIINITVLFLLFIIFKIPLAKYHILWIGAIIVFIYMLLWNKTHAQMHQQQVDITLKEGPSDYNMIPIKWYLNLIYLNHVKHHLQKGDMKGNYNVVMIGADEWLGTNVKMIDNREYCKDPEKKNENICKVDKYQYIPLDKIQDVVIKME
jgi:hypothetical protein